MCLVNQKHLRWIWLKQPQNNSKIGLTHAASETHSRTRAHTLEGYTAPLSVWVYLRAVFLAGHSCGNEYQMWFCSHKSKPSAVFWLSFPRLKSIRRGSVHYTYTPRLNSFLWNSHRGVFRSRRLRRGRGDIKACFECTAVWMHIMYYVCQQEAWEAFDIESVGNERYDDYRRSDI